MVEQHSALLSPYITGHIATHLITLRCSLKLQRTRFIPKGALLTTRAKTILFVVSNTTVVMVFARVEPWQLWHPATGNIKLIVTLEDYLVTSNRAEATLNLGFRNSSPDKYPRARLSNTIATRCSICLLKIRVVIQLKIPLLTAVTV